MSGARRGPNQGIDIVYSDVTAVASPIEITGISPIKPHCFVGVQFFSDAAGTTPVTPSAGTVTITVQTINNEPHYDDPEDNAIDATAPHTVDWAANTKAILATPAGITGASYYKLVATCNEA